LPPYVLDFYCPEARLVVEVDGEAHNRGNRPTRDAARDRILRERGLTILRVPARDVLASPENVAEAIAASVGMPLHRPAGGPPPHALHGEDRSGA
jgi:very-short-patch-repair endonuclease